MTDCRPKVVIVGIDGATWSLIAPWAEQGLLPTFARLMEQGAWGDLRSTFPPVTAPAWTSMITGRNPGKHGLFDFIAHCHNGYGVEYLCGGQRRCQSIWKTLSDRGYRVGVVNVPMTYPPEALNGFMISGLDTPDESSSFIYPSALKQEIASDFGAVRLDLRHLGYMDNDTKRSAVLEDLKQIEQERVALIEYLYKHHPTDALMFVMNAADQVQHHFWHYMDPAHGRFDSVGAERFGHTILDIYQGIDALLSRVLECFGEQTLYMLVSDHGFQAASCVQVSINTALAEAGLLTFHKSSSSFSTAVDKVGQTLRDSLSPRAKQKLAGLLPWARAKMDTMAATSLIDWSRTKAYSFEVMVTSPNVWINLKGKRPQGTVDPADYRAVLKQVKDCLLALKHPETGKPVITRVAEKQELFSGPALEDAPDLIPFWWEGEGFTPRPSVIGGKKSDRLAVELTTAPVEGGKEWGGTHSVEGIVLLKGPGVEQGRLSGADITDIAPTVFSALGEEPEADFDGQSLLVPAQTTRARRPPVDEQTSLCEQEVEVTNEDREKVKQRLRMLGYLE